MSGSVSALRCFDGHNDLLLRLWLMNDPERAVDGFFNGLADGHLDYPRCLQGGFGGGLFAVFVPPASYIAGQSKRPLAEVAQNHSALRIVEEQIALAHRLVARSDGRLRLCRTVAEIAATQQAGALALVLHIEGAEALDAGLSQLPEWIAAGVRSIGPFWNLPNLFGEGVSGGFPGSPDTGAGLTPAGEALLRTCNQQRLLIDLSHMNEKAFWQTAEISTAPLVATHSSAHALCPQPRNLTDAQLKAIAASGGLVGLNFGNAFLRADGKRDDDTPLAVMVAHIAHLLDKLGEEGVAFGSDFDGISVPGTLKDVTGLPRLLAALSAAGFDDRLIEKLRWGNWQRVLRVTWGG